MRKLPEARKEKETSRQKKETHSLSAVTGEMKTLPAGGRPTCRFFERHAD